MFKSHRSLLHSGSAHRSIVMLKRSSCNASRNRSEERRVGKECRSRCDWSSDVCSSDLLLKSHVQVAPKPPSLRLGAPIDSDVEEIILQCLEKQIGRASCRERV